MYRGCEGDFFLVSILMPLHNYIYITTYATLDTACMGDVRGIFFLVSILMPLHDTIYIIAYATLDTACNLLPSMKSKENTEQGIAIWLNVVTIHKKFITMAIYVIPDVIKCLSEVKFSFCLKDSI